MLSLLNQTTPKGNKTKGRDGKGKSPKLPSAADLEAKWQEEEEEKRRKEEEEKRKEEERIQKEEEERQAEEERVRLEEERKVRPRACIFNIDIMTWGGDFPQSLPLCVVKIWREMGHFSIQSGTGGVHQNVLGVILQYRYNI